MGPFLFNDDGTSSALGPFYPTLAVHQRWSHCPNFRKPSIHIANGQTIRSEATWEVGRALLLRLQMIRTLVPSASILYIKKPTWIAVSGENFSIIYDFDGHSYQQHCIVEDLGKGFALTEAHKHRLQCYYCVPGNIYNKFNILQYWKCRRYLQPNKWLQTWLRREIQALIQEEDVDVIVYHVSGIVDSFLRRNEHERFKGTPEQKREEFKVLLADAARPFLTGRTERFVKEVELFLVSGLNIEAYDQVYLQCLNLDTSSDTGGTEDDIHDQMLQVPNLRLFDEDIDTTD